jgi:hypothetical protein
MGIVAIAQDILADSKHHRAVPLDQKGERVAVLASNEPRQQLAIVQIARHAQPQERLELPRRHITQRRAAHHLGTPRAVYSEEFAAALDRLRE